MEQYYGMTAEMYRAVVALVDDRMREVRVVRQDYDRLAEAQQRVEGRMDRVEAALERLTEAQARTEERLERLEEAQIRTEERLERLEATVQQLAEAQRRTEERLEQLAEAQRRTAEQLADLIQVVAGMQDTLGAVKGRQLELTYRERAGAYFGPLLRHVRVVSPIEIEDDLEAHLSAKEFRDLLQLDLLVRGQPRHLPDAPQIWLAVEVSGVIYPHDVERAQRRAAALRRAGLRAIPTVAGEGVIEEAEEEARTGKVLLLRDGYALFWEEALEKALASEP